MSSRHGPTDPDPDTWLSTFADTLRVAALSPEETTLLLGLARDVAHGTQRRNAPLATFLAGVAVGGASDRSTALGHVAATAADLLVDRGDQPS